ncbi:hypothetical protein AAG570_008696 [Ranatra chinensis]|uniref:Cytochrome P450 n=1 Tax=Ranatra chinensis TaxID=642074 RepID=A0ABD0YRL7_9HEMI
MLGIHQDIQEKVLEEIDTVFGDSNREVTLEDLPKLVYLEQVIKETLRMWPPAAIILRNIDEDVKLSNCILPAGCTAALAAYALHMDEKIYPNPKKFDPSRFTPENIASRHKYSFLPFSGGPRSCIGSKYAMLSMKTTLSSFLRRYRVYSTCKIEDIRLELGLLMMSVDGYPVQIKERIPIVM